MQFLDQVVDMPVIVQIQGMVQTVHFVQFWDKVVDMPVVVQRQALLVQTCDVEQIVASCHRSWRKFPPGVQLLDRLMTPVVVQ